MKIKIHLKDPDGVANSIDEAVRISVSEIAGLSDDERERLFEERRDALSIDRWVEYGEYVSIEIDTDEDTARVLAR